MFEIYVRLEDDGRINLELLTEDDTVEAVHELTIVQAAKLANALRETVEALITQSQEAL